MVFLLVAWQDLKRTLRDPAGTLMTLAVPLALVVTIGLVVGRAPFQGAPADGFDALSYIAPGMALFFLMLSVRQSARTIAEDAGRGVRDRLRAAPVAELGVTAGGAFTQILLLFLQLLVLIGLSGLAYGVSWGPPWVLLVLCMALAVCASGWISLLVSVGRTPSRINALGMALTLTFGILGRSFAAVIPLSPGMDSLARLTPNYWGMHAFTSLALGGGVQTILRDFVALGMMCAATWIVAALIGRRRTPARVGRNRKTRR